MRRLSKAGAKETVAAPAPSEILARTAIKLQVK
jgi:hypothetical protein